MAEALVDQCRQLRLLEEETKIVDEEEAVGGSSSTMQKFMIVRTLLTIRPFNFKALGRTMESNLRGEA